MLGSNVQILEEIETNQGTVKLIKSVQHRYKTSPRAGYKTVISYEIYLLPNDIERDIETYLVTGRKADANKSFRLLKKHGLETYKQLIKAVGEFVA